MKLDEIISAQKHGEARGIASICSAHTWVLKAAMQRALRTGITVLIESTCNQVNQFGGYTGLTPADFVAQVRDMAREIGLPEERLLLGGDHLGPNVWQHEPARTAMEKSAQMVKAYIQAGYTKIHLDASMKLGDDDPARGLDMEVASQRSAFLARIAEETCSSQGSQPPRYVIGTEVPVPGGATEFESGVAITKVQDVRRTIEVTRAAFRAEGLEAAWERVSAVVVQPGLEFGDDFVLEYQPEKARELAGLIESEAGLVYEAHSTDYQTRKALRELVRDHFGILKVGPGLTFALREAIFALALMENEMFPTGARSQLMAVLEKTMLRDPRHWQKYYPGNSREQAFKRKYSLSDRIRYYWAYGDVQVAFSKLMVNMSQRPIPRALLSQYAPWSQENRLEGGKATTPTALLLARVNAVLDDYGYACGDPGTGNQQHY